MSKRKKINEGDRIGTFIVLDVNLSDGDSVWRTKCLKCGVRMSHETRSLMLVASKRCPTCTLKKTIERDLKYWESNGIDEE